MVSRAGLSRRKQSAGPMWRRPGGIGHLLVRDGPRCTNEQCGSHWTVYRQLDAVGKLPGVPSAVK